jgi:hypothetical protein
MWEKVEKFPPSPIWIGLHRNAIIAERQRAQIERARAE